MIKSLWKNKLQRAKTQQDINNVCVQAEKVMGWPDYGYILIKAAQRSRQLQK